MIATMLPLLLLLSSERASAADYCTCSCNGGISETISIDSCSDCTSNWCTVDSGFYCSPGPISASCSSDDDDGGSSGGGGGDDDGCSTDEYEKCIEDATAGDGSWEECDWCVCKNMGTLSSGSGSCSAQPEDLFECLVKYSADNNAYTCKIGATKELYIYSGLILTFLIVCCLVGLVRCCCRRRMPFYREPKGAVVVLTNPLIAEGHLEEGQAHN